MDIPFKKKQQVKREFRESTDLASLASKIFKEQKIDIRPAQVAFLLAYPNISKTTISKTLKTNRELKHFTNYDYIIEFSGDLWDALDKESQYLLLLHELLHIMPIMNEKTGEWEMKMRKPDVQGFSNIINRYGVDWMSKVKLALSSLGDLSPAQQDAIEYK